MKLTVFALLAALLGACSAPHFVGDVPPVPVTEHTPDRFELPARFAVARVIYGRLEAPGAREANLWNNLAARSESLGSFTPLVTYKSNGRYVTEASLIEAAREQRYRYLLMVRMNPEAGSADIALFDVGSGGVMATAQAISPEGGQRGFWGDNIRNPARLERLTMKIATAAFPSVENLLNGVAERQR